MIWLTLMRHAKSDWDDTSLRDFDRPLAPRGQKAAPLMGRHLRTLWARPGSPLEGIPPPERVLVSPARRTRETAELVRTQWPAAPNVEFVDALYDADADQVLAIARRLPPTQRHVMVIGHNNGLADLALELLAAPPGPDLASDVSKFPTAALAVIACDVRAFAHLQVNQGHLCHFMTPKRLISLKT